MRQPCKGGTTNTIYRFTKNKRMQKELVTYGATLPSFSYSIVYEPIWAAQL